MVMHFVSGGAVIISTALYVTCLTNARINILYLPVLGIQANINKLSIK